MFFIFYFYQKSRSQKKDKIETMIAEWLKENGNFNDNYTTITLLV